MSIDRWRGRVVELTTTTFSALFDNNHDFEVEVQLSSLPDTDRTWLEEHQVGCTIYLVFEDAGDTRTARFEFPQTRWTRAELDAAVTESVACWEECLGEMGTVVSAPRDL